MIDFYLSENSIADLGGGGLTLRRVVGSDVEQFSLFAHVHLRAQKSPVPESFIPRCIDLPMWLKSPTASRLLGCRPSLWLRQQPFLLRTYARSAAARIGIRLSTGTRPWLGLVVPQELESLYVTEALRQRYQVEYITWIMDDRFVRWRQGQWHYPPNVEKLVARHLRDAKVVFVISPSMADFYRQRFGVESQVLYGPADVIAPSISVMQPASDNVRIAYFGAVDGWQLDVLELMAQSCTHTTATLDIYSSLTQLPTSLHSPAVRLAGFVPAERVLETMASYDAVLLPIGFSPEMRQFSALNFATKMSESLASGTVTLAIGPAYAAMIQYLEQHSAALCVTSPTCDSFAAAIAELRDPERRKSLIDTAQALARREMSTQTMRETWSRGLAKLLTFQE